MQSHEIPRQDWAKFLLAFARQHDGWLTSVERQDDSRHSVSVKERPLRSASAETDSSGEARIAVVFEREDSQSVTAIAETPQKIRFLETEQHGHAGLEIDCADGSTLVLRFRSAIAPEETDGIAA